MVDLRNMQEPKYKYGQTIVKRFGYGDNTYLKIITMKVLRTAGLECDDDPPKGKKGTVNDKKLSENVSRAKKQIYAKAMNNPWDYFFTCTLSPEKYDRTDLEKFHKDLTQWFRNYGKRHGIKIEFLLIPELHKDGEAWHMHGLLHGLPVEHLHQFQIGDTMGKKLAEKVKKGDIVYDWYDYKKKFGWCDLEPVKNHEAVSKYIMKYVTKDLASCVTESGAHLYYCSRGLKGEEVIKRGTMHADIAPDFTNEYCSIAERPETPEFLDALLQSFD